MFDLEKSITDWKQAISRLDSMTGDNVCELENHLRDSIDELSRLGLSPSEAFDVACGRVGDGAGLEREYQKVNGTICWRNRIVWMMAGWIIGLGLAYLNSGVSVSLSSVVAFAGAETTVTALSAILITVLFWACVFGLVVYLSTRRTTGPTTSSGMMTIGIAGMALIVIGYILKSAGSIVSVRMLTPSEFGEIVYYTSYGGFAVQVIAIIAGVALMVALSPPAGSESAT